MQGVVVAGLTCHLVAVAFIAPSAAQTSAPAGGSAAAISRPRLASDVQSRLAARLPRRVDTALERLEAGFDTERAMALVSALDGTWRLAGNASFELAQDRVLERLVAAGFRHVPQRPAKLDEPAAWFESFPNAGHGWSHAIGRFSAIDAEGGSQVVLSRERHALTVCINSFSTPPGGITAELVDVGPASTAEALDPRAIRGRVVMGDADPRLLFRLAAAAGAVGVVSTALAPYVDPTPASAAGPGVPRAEWDILQWGAIPYDPTSRGFGFKATPRAAAELRARLSQGPVRVHVEVVSSFAERANRTLVAEVPGAVQPLEHVVLAAHVQEPGANDNASGMATLQELAGAFAQALRRRTLSRPDRSLTFLWGDELEGSREWLRRASADGRSVRHMLALDMTGHDVGVTGGSFLIEKAPDPSAREPSPFDPHTPWGGGQVDESWVRGTVLNDLVLAVCARYGAREGWLVRTNPYEGGSDHSVFLAAGVPSLLVWHFPDRYYHTNFDRRDKTSAAEMRRVGVSAAAAAYLLVSARMEDALALVDLLGEAVRDRLALEPSRGATAAAWRRWYHEALDEARGLPVEAPSTQLRTAVTRAQEALER